MLEGWRLCRDDEEDRYTFSSRLVGQTTPKRTNSLDSPAKGPAREWEDKGPRSGGERRTDNGPVRRALDVNRPGPARVRTLSPCCSPTGNVRGAVPQTCHPMRVRHVPLIPCSTSARAAVWHCTHAGSTHKCHGTRQCTSLQCSREVLL